MPATQDMDEASYRDRLPLLSNGELAHCLRAHAGAQEQQTITALIMEALARLLCAGLRVPSDPERKIHIAGCVGDPASRHAVVSVHEPDAIGGLVSSEESWQSTILSQESKGAINTLAAVGYLSAAERLRQLHEFHENIHDQLHALRVQPQLAVFNQILLPCGCCPFCERHINEQPGPILGVDGIEDRSERPALMSDDGNQPLVEDLIGHQGEHGSSSGEVIHDPKIQQKSNPAASVMSSTQSLNNNPTNL